MLHKAAFLATLSASGLLSGPKSFTDAAQIILSIRKNKNNEKKIINYVKWEKSRVGLPAGNFKRQGIGNNDSLFSLVLI